MSALAPSFGASCDAFAHDSATEAHMLRGVQSRDSYDLYDHAEKIFCSSANFMENCPVPIMSSHHEHTPDKCLLVKAIKMGRSSKEKWISIL